MKWFHKHKDIDPEIRKKFRSTKWGQRLLGGLMSAVMAVSVAVPAAAPVSAGVVGRNTVAIAALQVHAASHMYQVHANIRYFNPYNTIAGPVIAPIALTPNPVQPIAMADRLFWCGPEIADITVGIPLRVVTAAQVNHAIVWNLAETGLVVAGVAGAGAVALGTPVALGAAALGAGALGAAALGTTAVIGTGLALGAGALATTAVVGTTAAVGTAIVAHHLLNSGDEDSTDGEPTNEPSNLSDSTETTAESEPVLTAGTTAK